MFLIYFCFILNLFLTKASETCSKNENTKCGENSNVDRYSADANQYSKFISAIKQAKENYKPCNEPKCGCYVSVISKDLTIFKNGIKKEYINNIRSKGTKYQIVDHKLYREKTCMFPARCAGIEHFLLKLLPNLPNMELIINTRDWPQIHKNYGVFGPVFSFSKTQDYFDIMYPAWSFWEGGPAISLYPRGIGRWDILRKKLSKLANETSWNDKKNKAFFRGSRTSSERDPLVLLSRENPDLVDAQYTKNQAWKSDADTLNQPPASEVPFEDHCRFKYLFNFRGVAASFRLKHLFLCKSAVFHVGNEWLEFFYSELKPWIHYIPVTANAGKKELEDLLNFARRNDDLVAEIAENGFNFIWNKLTMNDVVCYWRKLLKKYASLLKFEVKLDEELVEINKK